MNAKPWRSRWLWYTLSDSYDPSFRVTGPLRSQRGGPFVCLRGAFRTAPLSFYTSTQRLSTVFLKTVETIFRASPRAWFPRAHAGRPVGPGVGEVRLPPPTPHCCAGHLPTPLAQEQRSASGPHSVELFIVSATTDSASSPLRETSSSQTRARLPVCNAFSPACCSHP